MTAETITKVAAEPRCWLCGLPDTLHDAPLKCPERIWDGPSSCEHCGEECDGYCEASRQASVENCSECKDLNERRARQDPDEDLEYCGCDELGCCCGRDDCCPQRPQMTWGRDHWGRIIDVPVW